jgi:hypothetical protein
VVATSSSWHIALRGHALAACIFAMGVVAVLVDAATLLLPRRRKTFLR